MAPDSLKLCTGERCNVSGNTAEGKQLELRNEIAKLQSI